MESYKALFLLCLVTLVRQPRLVECEEAKCECGVFRYPTEEKTKETPLVAKSPRFNFECNADGKASCSSMCVALAGASREEGPKKICELVENSEKSFVPLIYYKACDDDVWSFTGLKSTLAVCCKNREVIPCA